MQKILIIDDEVEHTDVLKLILSKHFEIIWALDGDEGFRLARSEQPDLILLDVFMPKMNGITVCGLLRSNESTRHIPVIMLTGAADTQNRVNAFSQGADDYVEKPYQINELFARIRSKLRRAQENRPLDAVIEKGNLKLDLEAIQVTVGDQPVALDMREFELLSYFARNPGKAITRKQLLEFVWRDSVVSERTADRYVARLRQKLVACNHDIATIQKAGYRFSPRLDA